MMAGLICECLGPGEVLAIMFLIIGFGWAALLWVWRR
jgi:hypothetical protein